MTESGVAGFTTTLSCTDPSGGASTTGDSALIDLAPGETVTCTFTNTAQPLADVEIGIDQFAPAALLSPAEAQTPGLLVIYSLTVTNTGPTAAENVSVTSPVPAGLMFESNTGACTTPVPCTLGTLAVGQSRVITTTPSAPPGFDPSQSITLTATVTSTTPDPDLCNNTASAIITISEIPTLPQWGMMLLTLALLTIAIWQLAGQRVVVGATAATGAVLPGAESQWLSSLFLGQGLATLGLGLYAVLVGPLVPHDGLGAFLAGLLLGVMLEGCRRSR